MSERDTVASGGDDTAIVRAAIYPAIGIARLGNSESEYFLAPEVPDPLPEPPGFYRNSTGALKRQSARFRLYGLNAAGRAVDELTADNAEISGRSISPIRNRPGTSFRLRSTSRRPARRRHPGCAILTIADRSRLVIDPGPRHISGRDVGGGPGYRFDTGTFLGTRVYLGEIWTDRRRVD